MIQLSFFVMYILFTGYSHNAGTVAEADATFDVNTFYPLFQDVHVMIFVGKKRGFRSIQFQLQSSSAI